MAELSVIVSLVDRYSAQASKFKSTVKGMRDQVRDFGKNVQEGMGQQLRASFDVAAFDQNLSNLENRANQARSRLTGAIAKGLVLAAPLKLAAGFDQSFKGLEKVVDAPAARLKVLRDFALQTSTIIPVAAREMVELMASAAQYGIDESQLEAFSTYAAKLAVAFDMAGSVVGERLAKLKNVYKLNQTGLEGLGDAVNHLTNNMAGSGDEITDFVNRAAGGAAILKLTATHTAAFGTAMVAAGIVPETAARGFNALASRVVGGGKKVEGAFEAIGWSRKGFMDALHVDGAEAVQDLFEKLSSSKNGQKALIDLVGMDFADDFGKLLGNPELIDKALTLIEKAEAYKGSASDEAAKQATGAEKQFELMVNRLTRSAVIVGNVLLPIFLDIANGIGKAADAFAAFAAANPELTAFLVKAVAGIMGLSIALSVIGFAFASARLGLFRFLGLFFRFGKAGKNISLAAKAVRGIGAALGAITPLSWAKIIPRLAWGAMRFIPSIGWAVLAGELAWNLLIKPLGWDEFLNLDGLAAGWDKVEAKLNGLVDRLRDFLGLKSQIRAGEEGYVDLPDGAKGRKAARDRAAPERLSAEEPKRLSAEEIADNAARHAQLKNTTSSPTTPSRVIRRSRNAGGSYTEAQPALPGAVDPARFEASKAELSAILTGFGRTKQGLEDGSNRAGETIKSAGQQAGDTMGAMARQALEGAAPAIGAAIGQAAAAHINQATVNVRVEGDNALPKGRRARKRAEMSTQAALHDGVDE